MSTITMRNLRTSCLSHHNTSKAPLNFLLPTTSILRKTSQPPSSQRRYASTSTSTTTATPITLETSKINAPTSTLPAIINTPVRTPDQTALLYYIALGKSYVTFYKTGILNVKTNFSLSRPIQSLVSKKYSSSPIQAAQAGALTRSEFQLLARNAHDIKRVPMFALVVLICGEFTPLVVIALSNVVPWTCRIPKQIANDRRKLESRRSISFRNLTLPPPEQSGVDTLERMQLLHISWSLGLSSRSWDWLGGQLPGLPTGILRSKVAKRVEYLECDDSLIWMYGGVEEMSLEEVKMACVERGIDVLERKETDLRADLQNWLDSREKVPVEKLLLTRPSVWPSNTTAKSTTKTKSKPPKVTN